MPRVIYKYPLLCVYKQEVSLPIAAEILRIAQDPAGTPCLWAEVDPSHPSRTTTVYVIGTGELIPVVATRYLGTFTQGADVWHVYL